MALSTRALKGMRYGTESYRWIGNRLGPPPPDDDRPHAHTGVGVSAGWHHRLSQPTLARLYGPRHGPGPRSGVARTDPSRRPRDAAGDLGTPPRLGSARRGGSTPPTWRWRVPLVPLACGAGARRAGTPRALVGHGDRHRGP